mgnify:FL=1
MEIGIIGTGSVGETLGRGFVDAGHDVVFGSRGPEDDAVERLVDDIGEGARAATTETAAADGGVVVLAVPGSAAPDVAADLADELAGKAVVDPTNSMERTSDAVAARIAAAAPEARVVKAFNTIGDVGMADPEIDGERATMFVASDDPDATAIATALASDLGFGVVDAGSLDAALLLEDLARLWIHLSRSHGRDIGFRLLGA